MPPRNGIAALLARLDERTSGFSKSLDEIKATQRSQTQQVVDLLNKHIAEDNTRFDINDKRFRIQDRWIWLVTGGSIAVFTLLNWLLKGLGA